MSDAEYDLRRVFRKMKNPKNAEKSKKLAFICASTSGMKYQMVVYDYDSNNILVEPMKSRTSAEHTRAYKVIFKHLKSRGFKPKLQKLDNETSAMVKDFLTDNGFYFQLTPAGIHRHNAAELAIRTWKNRFIANLCGTDPDLTLELWDRLVPQCIMTLNLLRKSIINPKLSAYAQIKGMFDFNKTPLAPIGMKVIVHKKPESRLAWSPHGVDGWYLGPAMHHCQCYRVWTKDTLSERIADTLTWFSMLVEIPKTSSADAAVVSAQQLTAALRNQSPATPLAPIFNKHRAALDQLARIFDKLNPKPDASPPRVSEAQTSEPSKPPRVSVIIPAKPDPNRCYPDG